ncbi:carbohydrate binding domain-containing protein [Sunxiuqinia indica]|uniref:carbohydrate binding domain-containing protein n=1 Tax=Sunxiuqinia indica TaxID=2692584 RepID=UPI00135B1BA5|nr:carbohydrate binding domain-containing protein [Sunxiuqinia indica]
MNLNYSKIALLILFGCTIQLVSPANSSRLKAKKEESKNDSHQKVKKYQPNSKENPLVVEGTNNTSTLIINSENIQEDHPVLVTASPGFSVSQTSFPANSKNNSIEISYDQTLSKKSGVIIFRSGSIRSYVHVKGLGTPLPKKDISAFPVYVGGDLKELFHIGKNGFVPLENGFTIEMKVKTDRPNQEFRPYVVTEGGIGFKAYINNSGMGLYNSDFKKGIKNPITSVEGGLGRFYNDDHRFHIYRFSVASDNRIFLYRDGLPIDTLSAVDYGLQPDFAVRTGTLKQNLLKNPDFEGEFATHNNVPIAKSIEGWDILIGDVYNSEQYIIKQEIDNEQDFNNHILRMNRYEWSDGWSAAEIGQIVDVAPNETYTLSALIRGGYKKESGKYLGKIKIQEVQDRSLGITVDVASNNWETYSMDYTTSPSCKQIRIFFFLERNKGGGNISPLEVDNVKLTGMQRLYDAKIGFENKQAVIEYFTYDTTGVYAPLTPKITIDSDNY